MNKFLTTFFVAIVGLLIFSSCVREQQPDNREKDYGYVQFKLYKEASYDGAAAKSGESQLDYLSQAAKIKVTLKYGGVEISQTMTLGAADNDMAEYGLRSDKLQLLCGDYEVASFVLFDKLDNYLYTGDSKETIFSVVP